MGLQTSSPPGITPTTHNSDCLNFTGAAGPDIDTGPGADTIDHSASSAGGEAMRPTGDTRST